MIDELVCAGTANPTDLVSDRAQDPSPAIVTGVLDGLLLAGEWSFRQLYWRSALLRNWIKRQRATKATPIQVAPRQDLIDYLRVIGVTPGALIMAHTSVTGLSFDPEALSKGQTPNSLQVAQDLVFMLEELIGDTGTLVMPTHPVYKNRSGSPNVEAAPPIYNPRTTPCGVGLANELFWRQDGTQRSLYPHNTLAARGPLAESFLANNLNDSKPLPHGTHSGYHRFCQRNGLLISIGVPLASCFTLVHAAEEARDEHFPVRDFFEERNYLLRHAGQDRPVTIRKTRTEFMMFSLCIRKLRRDLVAAGILHEGRVGTIRVDWAFSNDVFRFISDRNRTTTYPYFGTSLVARKFRAHANP